MDIQWLGTAGFKIQTKGTAFLLDPFLSRNENATPFQKLKPSDISNVSQIFVSHGHFDHIKDVPHIAKNTKAAVYCSTQGANYLKDMDLDNSLINEVSEDKWEKDFLSFKAIAYFSEHVKFDKKLLISTLFKINFRIFNFIDLMKKFPCGQVLSWRFFIEDRIVHFFGSAGSSVKELENIADTPTDILLIPLQGHSDICDIAFEYVKVLKPKIVIPHHQDDFYPPISKMVDIKPFVQKVDSECKHTRIKILKLNETLSI